MSADNQIGAPLGTLRERDAKLAGLLPQRDSLKKVLDHLESSTNEDQLIEEALEIRRIWQDSGQYYAFTGRFWEAIELFSRLNERIGEIRLKRNEWIPCGMPLVWIADYYRHLGCPLLAFRHLLLSGISDAIRDKGKINPNAGFYWRARWLEKLSDEGIKKLYESSFAEFEKRHANRFFPEYLLGKIGQGLISPFPSPAELNIYAVNRVYAGTLLARIKSNKAKPDGKDLEALAAYLLGCVPGFEALPNVIGRDTQIDAVIRSRGARYDFREDLGTYFLVECKDWSKPIGSSEVGWFVNKLLTQECKAGILFSSRGISGESSAANGKDVRHGALTLLKAYHRAGRIIITLREQDFEAASRGENLIRILQREYEMVRFDIRTK